MSCVARGFTFVHASNATGPVLRRPDGSTVTIPDNVCSIYDTYIILRRVILMLYVTMCLHAGWCLDCGFCKEC